jgi:signal transduction histidine kinase
MTTAQAHPVGGGEAPRVHRDPPASARELGALFAEFNEVTSRLHATHERLTAEVSRLKSELRQARSQLARSRELAALGEMAAGIAHEIRNPLASIGLYASMLRDDLRGERPEQSAMAMKICDAVGGLDRIVGDVLAFAREVRLRPEPLSARDALLDAAQACAQEAERLGVTLRIGEGDGRIEADRSLLRQALVNVVRNACEACAEAERGGGIVELGVGRASARREDGGAAPMVALRVRDTGPGVSEDVKRRMFNPFFTTRAAGTGLGLAIVHRIMDAHAGRVTVENIGPGGGAVVELLLPASADGGGSQEDGRQGGGA